MFKKRCEQLELMDDLALSSDALIKNLDELSYVNRWLGGKRALLTAVNKIYQKYHHYFKRNVPSLVDIGCGSGDLLRSLQCWSQRKRCNIALNGIDANAFTLRYAEEKSKHYPEIRYEAGNIFSSAFTEQRFDIVTLNSVCHHFTDTELSALLQQLRAQTNLAIIINDFHRHWLAYYSIICLTRLLPCSYLIKYDAPLSVLRAFRKRELIELLATVPDVRVQIRWKWAFRWQVIIWCQSPL